MQTFRFALPLLAAACLLQALPQEKKEDPDAPLKTLFEHACSQCHATDKVIRSHNTRERWDEIVNEMIGRGAEISDADADKIVDYLARHYGKDK